MPRSYLKNIVRTFKSTRSRFASIFAIVALGVGFLAGLSATPVDMKASMERYMDDGNFYDLRVVSTLGLTDDDVNALAALDRVERVQPGYSLDVMLQAGPDAVVARAHSLPPDDADAINKLLLVEGRMPQSPQECVVEAGANVTQPSHPIGQRLTALPVDKLDEKLAETEFTIVGIVRNTNYFSFEREPASVGNGTVGLVLYLPKESFAYEAYTELYLTATGALMQNSLADPYQATVDAMKAEVECIQDARCEARYTALRSDAQKELDDAWKEYYDGVAEADQELADAAAELADGREKLADGEQEVRDGEKELADGEKELIENEDKVTDGAAQLNDALRELADGEDAWKKGQNTLLDSEAELAAALRDLQEGQRLYEDGARIFEDGAAQLEDAKIQLDAAGQTLAAGRAEYEEGKAAFDKGEADLAAAGEQLRQSKAVLDAGWADYKAGLAEWEQGTALLGQLNQMATAETAYAANLPVLTGGLNACGLAVSEPEVAGYFTEQAKRPMPATAESAQPPMPTPQEFAASFSAYLGRPLTWLVDPADPMVLGLVAGAEQAIQARCALNAGIQALIDAGVAPDEAGVRLLLTPESRAALAAQLDAAKAPLDAAKQQLDAGQKQYDEGFTQWQAGCAELEKNRRVLADAKAELDAGQKQYDEGLSEWRAGKAALEEKTPELRDAKATLDEGWAAYYDGVAAFEKGKKELAESRQTLTDGWATLTDKQLELDDARQKLADARVTLADARRELADARVTLAEKMQELRDGEIEYADAKAEVEQELADARVKIEDGEKELNDLELPEWYLWDRSQNVSYASFDGNVAKLQAITTIFPIFFFLVAALVVSSTMTRMVDEERLQIGTLKALGYRPGEIMQKYLLYAVAASVAGALVGLAVGFYAFPTIIWTAYTMMYYMPAIYTPWLADKAIFAGGALVGLSAAVSVLACRASLTEVPAALLLPRAPKAGKRILLERIGPLWRRLPFTYKVTARNLMRYKRRFWMTVIGVAGCTALLVAGFGISDSLNAIIEKQYGEVYRYQLMTVLTKNEADADTDAHRYLFEEGPFTESLAVSLTHLDETAPDGSKLDAYLMVPENTAAFARYADLHERISGSPTPLGEQGVVLTEKLAKLLGAKTGEQVTLANGDGKTAVFTVAGVCEHYVYNYIYMSAATYQAGFDSAPGYNAILSLMQDAGPAVRDEVSERLLALDHVASVTFTHDSMQMVLNMLNSIDAVVVLIIVCAACLAFVVLYNLNNINIAERVKEIATIKVLGFYDREVNGYVNRESVALTLIGTALGLVLGIWLHQFIIVTVEVDAVMFGRSIKPVSFVYAAALTLLFGTLVNLVMTRALRRISMVESMKAPE